MPIDLDRDARLFRIGIKPLGDAPLFLRDDRLGFYLAEKQRLISTDRDAVFQSVAGSEAAQHKVLEFVADKLGVTKPEGNDAPLLKAAGLVAEDLLVLQRNEDGWRLIAGSLCFPSSWRLGDKIGNLVDDIHAPVPEFGPHTRNAQLITRMFDNLRACEPVIRWNWSVYDNPSLFHPHDGGAKGLSFEDGDEAAFLRIERQVLNRVGQDLILFSVHVSTDPLAVIAQEPDAANLALLLKEQVDGLDADQVRYKGLTAHRDALSLRLAELMKA